MTTDDEVNNEVEETTNSTSKRDGNVVPSNSYADGVEKRTKTDQHFISDQHRSAVLFELADHLRFSPDNLLSRCIEIAIEKGNC